MRVKPKPGSKIHLMNLSGPRFPFFKTVCGIVLAGQVYAQPTAFKEPFVDCDHCKPRAIIQLELREHDYEFSHSQQARQVYNKILEHYRRTDEKDNP